jgi:hypothetical protein
VSGQEPRTRRPGSAAGPRQVEGGATPGPAVPAGGGPARLTVREMQLALAAARGAAAGRRDGPAPASDWHSAERLGAGPGRVAADTDLWVPAHDGPVSLAGVPPPRRVAAVGRRPVPRPRPGPRAPGVPGGSGPRGMTRLEPTLTARLAAAPPRLLVVGACGGAGATTVTVLLGAALAPLTGAVLLAGVSDHGALRVRANATDHERVTERAGTGPELLTGCRLAGADVGVAGLAVAQADREDSLSDVNSRGGGDSGGGGSGAALLVGAAEAGAAVLLDWPCRAGVPFGMWATLTAVVVVAPSTAPGMLAAERVSDRFRAGAPPGTPVGLLIVEVHGRRGRVARGSRARLRALGLSVAELPYDPALAREPRICWPRLRARTRGAVHAAVTRLLSEAGDRS